MVIAATGGAVGTDILDRALAIRLAAQAQLESKQVGSRQASRSSEALQSADRTEESAGPRRQSPALPPPHHDEIAPFHDLVRRRSARPAGAAATNSRRRKGDAAAADGRRGRSERATLGEALAAAPAVDYPRPSANMGFSSSSGHLTPICSSSSMLRPSGSRWGRRGYAPLVALYGELRLTNMGNIGTS